MSFVESITSSAGVRMGRAIIRDVEQSALLQHAAADFRAAAASIHARMPDDASAYARARVLQGESLITEAMSQMRTVSHGSEAMVKLSEAAQGARTIGSWLADPATLPPTKVVRGLLQDIAADVRVARAGPIEL